MTIFYWSIVDNLFNYEIDLSEVSVNYHFVINSISLSDGDWHFSLDMDQPFVYLGQLYIVLLVHLDSWIHHPVQLFPQQLLQRGVCIQCVRHRHLVGGLVRHHGNLFVPCGGVQVDMSEVVPLSGGTCSQGRMERDKDKNFNCEWFFVLICVI